MSRVACPHCGFLNFSISAYCGRCERPVKKSNLDEHEALSPPNEPTDVEPTPQQVPAEVELSPLTAQLANVAHAQPTPPPAPVPTLTRPKPAAPVQHIPPPLPPLSLETAPPAVVPIELNERATKKAAAFARGPRLTALPSDPNAEVPIAIPGLWRVGLASLVDLSLVLSFGILVAFVEQALASNVANVKGLAPLDQLAQWLQFHSDIAVHACIGAGVFGLGYSVAAAMRSGQTLGRFLTGTVLVRKSGKPVAWWLVGVRAVVSVASVLLLGAGFFWPIVDRYSRTWHDALSGMVVVKRRVQRVQTP